MVAHIWKPIWIQMTCCKSCIYFITLFYTESSMTLDKSPAQSFLAFIWWCFIRKACLKRGSSEKWCGDKQHCVSIGCQSISKEDVLKNHENMYGFHRYSLKFKYHLSISVALENDFVVHGLKLPLRKLTTLSRKKHSLDQTQYLLRLTLNCFPTKLFLSCLCL